MSSSLFRRISILKGLRAQGFGRSLLRFDFATFGHRIQLRTFMHIGPAWRKWHFDRLKYVDPTVAAQNTPGPKPQQTDGARFHVLKPQFKIKLKSQDRHQCNIIVLSYYSLALT
jgi:hypothetical protein